MEQKLREKVRIAGMVREQLVELRDHGELAITIRPALRRMEEILGIVRKFEKSRQRRWYLAAREFQSVMRGNVRSLRFDLETLDGGLSPKAEDIPTIRELIAELDHLKQEFGGWAFDSEEKTLTVTTESIELEAICLGPFEIRLHLGNLSSAKRRAYSVVAFEPHPACQNEEVTHPHVRDEQLCEGDAGSAIRNALGEGRLCDLFQLISSVLNTYNPDSPFVKLSEWEGTPCYDCGSLMGEDSQCWCEGCEHDFCSECISSCKDCDTALCQGCLERCALCEKPVCGACLKKCSECREACCRQCLDKDLCEECAKEVEHEEEHLEEVESPPGGEQGDA
jgi:hypothetical protein